MNKNLLLTVVSAAYALSLISCADTTPAETLRTEHLQNREVLQLNISATKNTLIVGERTRIQALASVGKSPTNVTAKTEFYVEGPGDIERENGKAYYVATSTTENEESTVHATLDPSYYGGSGETLKSNQLNMFVLSREDHKITMPSRDSFETDSPEYRAD